MRRIDGLLVTTLLAFTFATMTSGTADARGETSYRLPEIRKPVPPASGNVDAIRWQRASDAAPEAGSMLAYGGGIVAFAVSHRVCGFRERDGARRWCAGNDFAPVYADGAIAYAAADGGVRAVDARTGRMLWTRSIGSRPSPGRKRLASGRRVATS